MALLGQRTALAGIGNVLRFYMVLSVALLSFSGALRASPHVRPLPQGLGETQWEQITSPALSKALEGPERLWAFLTDPRTPYQERMAAAVQGKRVFALSGLVRLVETKERLGEEHRLHRWGLLVPPSHYGASGPLLPLRPLSPQERRRQILGHLWIVPETPTDFEPDSAAAREMEATAWPLQVETALNHLYSEIAPQMHIHNPPTDVAYAERWYAEAFKLPCNTDRQATVFVDVTSTPHHYKSLRLLVRWRRIAMNPHFPEAAIHVASDCGEAMHLWGDERAQDIGQALLCDILRANTNKNVRIQAAWSSQYLLTRFTGDGDRKLDPPMQVVVTLGDLAIDPANGSEADRLYSFVNPLFRLMPDAPMREDIAHMNPQSPRVHTILETFAAWFRIHRSEFVRAGDKQIHALKEIAILRAPTF